MGRIMYMRQCPEPEMNPEEYCDCMCKNAKSYTSCFEECMLDYGDYEE